MSGHITVIEYLQRLQIFFSKKILFLLQFIKNNANLHSSKGGKPPKNKKPKNLKDKIMNNKETFYLVEVYHLGTAVGSLISLDHVHRCKSLESAKDFGSIMKEKNGWFEVTEITSEGRSIVFDSRNN